VTGQQLALDCEPTWLDPEPDDEDDGPWCLRLPDLWGYGLTTHDLATMTDIPTGSYL